MRSRTAWRVLGVLGVAAAAAGVPAAADKASAARQAVEARAAAWTAACNRGDVRALGELYEEGAMLLPPNTDRVVGRANIETFLAGLCDGKGQGEAETLDLGVEGDLAFHVGTYRIQVAGATVDHGKFVEVWKRTGKVWRIRADIVNSSAPHGH